jgi:hypothetical protein
LNVREEVCLELNCIAEPFVAWVVGYFVVMSVQFKKDEMGRALAQMGETNTYRILVGKPEGKRPLGRPGRRWENTAMNLQVP